MGQIMTRLMAEKGVDIVGAIGRSANIGKDLGEVAGLGYPLNVLVEREEDRVLETRAADIAVVAVGSYMADMLPHFRRCLENGLNVITLAEEAVYPWKTAPSIAAELDRLAKAHGVTITASGGQDVFWVNLPTMLSGASHTIRSISGFVLWNINDFGPEVAKSAYVGWGKRDLEEHLKSHPLPPSFGKNAIQEVAADLGLTMTRVEEVNTLETADVDLECASLGVTVKSGDVIGRSELVTIETKEGIQLSMREGGRLYKDGESDVVEWTIDGYPALHLRCDRVPTQIMCCTQMVNRIPDVIASSPGYITVDQLPKLKFRAAALHHYLST
jgi:4-hydroxy-tetrahydrodipicolinate reductase